jgi:hypothetical protein
MIFDRKEGNERWEGCRPNQPKLVKARNTISLRASGGNVTCSHLDFMLLASRTVKEYISVALTHHLVVICYGSYRKPSEKLKCKTRPALKCIPSRAEHLLVHFR